MPHPRDDFGNFRAKRKEGISPPTRTYSAGEPTKAGPSSPTPFSCLSSRPAAALRSQDVAPQKTVVTGRFPDHPGASHAADSCLASPHAHDGLKISVLMAFVLSLSLSTLLSVVSSSQPESQQGRPRLRLGGVLSPKFSTLFGNLRGSTYLSDNLSCAWLDGARDCRYVRSISRACSMSKPSLLSRS